jgi:mono/diheme cytochrome c family protein
MKKQLGLSSCALVLVSVGLSAAFAADAKSGKEMYLQYCSSCHSQDGRGSGAVSAFLKVKVPDLTPLKKKNKGIYPMEQVMFAIDGRRKLRAHGDPSCPCGEKVSARK